MGKGNVAQNAFMPHRLYQAVASKTKKIKVIDTLFTKPKTVSKHLSAQPDHKTSSSVVDWSSAWTLLFYDLHETDN